MKKIDTKEFELLAGTRTMEEFIRNRVVVTLDDPDNDDFISDIYNHAQQLCVDLYYVRKVSGNQLIFYFLNPIDRSRFSDSFNQNI